MRKTAPAQRIRAALAIAYVWGTCLHIGRCEEASSPTPPPYPAVNLPAKSLTPSRVSFYAVQLVCPAAPHIGCGSASKPLLLELEASGIAAEAWLNRAGTLLAIVWSERSTSSERFQLSQASFKSREMAGKELSGRAKRRAWKDFESGGGWYRGRAVDQLSEEEAGIIAGRWVAKIRQRIAVADSTADLLQKEFTDVIAQKLLGQISRNLAQEEMVAVCRKHLNQEDVAVLLKAFAEDVESWNKK